MTGVLIKVPHKLDSVCIEREISRFLTNPSGYLTLDFLETKRITDGGLDQILEAADTLQGPDGNLQLINISEDIYLHLINTNISDKRLLNLAEIYTNRERKDLGKFIRALGNDYEKFGVKERHFFKLAQKAGNRYEELHSSFEEEGCSEEEFERRRVEYCLIECIRDIEENEIDTLDHLGYVYKETSGIKKIEDIKRALFQRADMSKLINGARLQAPCKTWYPADGYGFLKYGRKDIWVRQAFIVGASELIPEEMYEFTAKYLEDKGWRGYNVEPVNPQ